MTDNVLQFKSQSENDPLPWQTPISWKKNQLARLDLFIHWQPGIYMAGLMVTMVFGAVIMGASVALVTKNFSALTCVMTWAVGSAVLALAILTLLWRTRREYGRPASAEMIAALRRLIPAERWKTVAEHAAAHRIHSPRNPATLSEILGWLDLAVIAEKQTLPLTLEEAAVIRGQTRAFS